MTRQLIWALLAASALAVGSLYGQSKTEVPFPEGYRSWTHVKSMVIVEGHVNYDAFGGIHHVYANQKAIAALKDGKPFEKGDASQGSVTDMRSQCFSCHETQKASDYVGTFLATTRRHRNRGIGIM